MRSFPLLRPAGVLAFVLTGLVAVGQSRPMAQSSRGPEHARRYQRLLIHNAMVIYGNGKPAYGPMDLMLQDGLIADIRPSGSFMATATPEKT